MNNYFSHDSNARNSDKLIPLRMRWGAEGYGIYFMILERLREEPEYTSVKDYNMIAFDLRVDTGKVKSVIEDFGLFVFTDDGKYFYSESFKRRMTQKDEKSRKLSDAGKKGNERRWKNNVENQQDNRHPIATQSPPDRKCDENLSQEKERKEKESKEEYTIQELGIDPKFGDPLFSIEKLREEMSYQSTWIEQVGMLNHLTPETIDYWINEFFNVLIKRGSNPKSVKDFKNHFPDWLNIQLEKEKKRVKSPPGKISKTRQMILNAQKLMKPDE